MCTMSASLRLCVDRGVAPDAPSSASTGHDLDCCLVVAILLIESRPRTGFEGYPGVVLEKFEPIL